MDNRLFGNSGERHPVGAIIQRAGQVLEEHYRRLDERLDRLVKDLKSSNVDLGISDNNGGE